MSFKVVNSGCKTMTRYTIGVYRKYKNAGNTRFHKKETKKHWCHYFIDDEFDDGDTKFSSEWVSAIKAVFLKRKQLYKRQFICPDCGDVTEQFVPKNTDEMPCAKCNDDE